MKVSEPLLIGIVLLFLSASAVADPKLPTIFSDNMVLQRDIPIEVWGWADPKEVIVVQLNARELKTTADRSGNWSVKFDPISAGGPYEMIVRGKKELRVRNLLFGDLWLCGGQSNMQWTVAQTGWTEIDTAFIKSGDVRLFTVHVGMDYMPQADLNGSGWLTLSPDNINAFSAVGYHFGKFLHREIGVPIGLISDNLGATSVETWMSNQKLAKFPQFASLIDPVIKKGKGFKELMADFEKTRAKWEKQYYLKGPGFDGQWYLPPTDVTDWKEIDASGNSWENEPALRDHDGAVWFRTTFDLPEDFSGAHFHLGLGQIDDYDIVWVNGKKVGETFGKHNHRNYQVPREILKETDNVLVVRVFDNGDIGGFTTHPFWGNDILRGKWSYRRGRAIAKPIPEPFLPNVTPFSSPGVLFNANIAPLTRLAIKGVIWYQGESNADRAHEYRALFPALIDDWRKQFGNPELPFLFVQLANYGAESVEPGESNWAELREAQAMALSLPNTGMASAIDIGEAGDIHPRNKQEVGARLGKVALKVAYGNTNIALSPTFKSTAIDNRKALIEFDSENLISRDKYGFVRGFQIAGADQKFYWARAYIRGKHVVVESDHVSDPVAVRYAWDNNPGQLDLFSKDGLPALPFRTDTWRGITEGKVFEDGPRF